MTHKWADIKSKLTPEQKTRVAARVAKELKRMNDGTNEGDTADMKP